MTERDLRMRAREVRAGLPGQLRRERLTTAALLYGPLASLDEVHVRLARTLPWRPGYVRRLLVEPIERSEAPLPDDVLVKCDDAVQLGIFSRFLVATPAYYWRACGSPWLIAEVHETERWAVIVGWDAEATDYTQPRGLKSAAGRY